MDDFVLVHRLHGDRLLHKTKPMWIVHYPLPNNHTTEFWQVYRVIDHYLPVPPGRDPWTLNNVAIGGKHGFPTLEAAMEAVRDFGTCR